jgi:hypothetical protein
MQKRNASNSTLEDIQSKVNSHAPRNFCDEQIEKIHSLAEVGLVESMKAVLSNRKNMFNDSTAILNDSKHMVLFLARKLIYLRDSSICLICGVNVPANNYHIDHIIPKSKFPTSHPWNLQLLCSDCNTDKSDEILNEIPLMLNGAKKRTLISFNKNIMQFTQIMNFHYNTLLFLDIKFFETIETIINEIISRKDTWENTLNKNNVLQEKFL